MFACFKCKIVVARLCLGPGPLDRAGGHLPAGDNVAAAGVHKAPPQTGAHLRHIPAGAGHLAGNLQVHRRK